MRIPQGDWIVVERAVRDTTSRGRIVRSGLTERGAKRIAAANNRAYLCGGHNYWAMPRQEY